MNLVRLYVPTANELAYRRFLIGDEETMSYNQGYGDNGGCTYAQTEEEALRWWDYWNSKGNCYAYVVRNADNKPVGEVSIHFPDDHSRENGFGWIEVLIEAAERNKGYGEEALKLLIDYAWNKLGLKKLLDDVPVDREESVRLFERLGFRRNELMNVMELER